MKADSTTVSEAPPARGNWSSKLEFLLSCLNYAVGLGNIWRFPYLVYRNGGGAFLLPYIIMLFAMGLPIFYLELVIGQYSGLGSNKLFQRMAPIFHGLGYCTLVVITLITIYYQVIVAWTVFYIFASFTDELGWGSCGHDFNTNRCYTESANAECQSKSDNEAEPWTFVNRACHLVTEVCAGLGMTMENRTHCYNETDTYHLNSLLHRTLASEEYYRDYALGILGSTWESWGILRWQTVLCLLLSWLILYVCLMKGIQSSGKAAYFTAIFPYCILLALLIRGLTLEGSYEGVMFYITPTWEALTDAGVWGDAASQTFYALGIGCSSLITLASYNRFDNNCHRDAFFVTITNTLTAILSGFVVFSMLGFLAKEMGQSVDEVVDSGPGLAFVTYPEAVLRMPLPQLWSVLFFFMLFTLGIGSQFGGVEAINTAIIDNWPKLRTSKHWVAAGTCTTCFLLALPMCCSGGVYLFTILDWNTAYWAIFVIGFAELALVAWVYGCRRFLGNIAEMSMPLSKFTRAYWIISWGLLAPGLLLAILIFTLYSFTPAYFGSYTFPVGADVLGWLVGVASLVPMPIFAIYRIIKGEETGWQLLQPTALWGPSTASQLPTSNENVDSIERSYSMCENSHTSDATQSEIDNTDIQKKISDISAHENLAFQSDDITMGKTS